MIIDCESCGTRFNLADGQVPPQGARVRCSKCHHRFHVMPPMDADPEPTPEEVPGPPDAGPPDAGPPDAGPPDAGHPDAGPPAASPPAAGPPNAGRPGGGSPDRGRRGAGRPGAAAGGDDPDLDNPEFLFDPKEEADAGLARDEVEFSEVEEDLSEPDSTPSLGTTPEDHADVREQVFGLEPDQELSRRRPDDDAPPVEEPAAKRKEMPSRSAADTLDDWDATPELDNAGEDGRSTPPPPAPLSGSDRVARASAAPPPRLPEDADGSSVASRAAGAAVRTTAVAIGVLLVLGGVRLLLSHGVGARPGPDVVRAHGWTATDIEARHVEDELGRRVLVLRGALIPEGPGRPPRVQTTLLDELGKPVMAEPVSVLERLEGAALAPEAVGNLLRAGAEGFRRRAGPVSGFTVLIPGPPEAARRFRLDLLPAGEASPSHSPAG